MQEKAHFFVKIGNKRIKVLLLRQCIHAKNAFSVHFSIYICTYHFFFVTLRRICRIRFDINGHLCKSCLSYDDGLSE